MGRTYSTKAVIVICAIISAPISAAANFLTQAGDCAKQTPVTPTCVSRFETFEYSDFYQRCGEEVEAFEREMLLYLGCLQASIKDAEERRDLLRQKWACRSQQFGLVTDRPCPTK